MTHRAIRTRGANPRRGRHPETVILFFVANQMFAIAADAVQEIRSTDSLAGAANEIDNPELPKVRHTIDRSGRTYYVVNAGAHFGLPVTRPALVLILRQFRVAVLVDRIERMAEIPRRLSSAPRFHRRRAPLVSRPGLSRRSVIPVVEPTRLSHAAGFSAARPRSQRKRSGANPKRRCRHELHRRRHRQRQREFLRAAADRSSPLGAARRAVAELAPPVRLHTFPHTTPLFAGVIVRRGRIVPVI